jgi:hypothetical protein
MTSALDSFATESTDFGRHYETKKHLIPRNELLCIIRILIQLRHREIQRKSSCKVQRRAGDLATK